MELVNEFTVNRPTDEAWAILTDVERIAPCMPGAQLQQIEGDVYRGVVKVKVGPIGAALKGEAKFVERDDVNHRAVLKAEGRDTKGNGNASALITATLEELSPTSAKCGVHTDLNMTGKVAQFGRGALGDISAKLMQQFAKNLDEMLSNDTTEKVDTDVKVDTTEKIDTEEKADSAAKVEDAALAAEPLAEKAPSVRTIDGPAAEPIDAFSLGGSAVLKRVLPIIAALVILLLALRRRNKD
jgi:carbon monoxide dehydrogenase subunit G